MLCNPLGCMLLQDQVCRHSATARMPTIAALRLITTVQWRSIIECMGHTASIACLLLIKKPCIAACHTANRRISVAALPVAVAVRAAVAELSLS
jgi:hypothetical protein